MSGAPRRLRVLVHAQHLSGVGHYVRMHEVGRALAARHEVHLIDGGRPVPRADPGALRFVELPRIERAGHRLVGVADGAPATALMGERAARLAAAVAAIAPDVVIVEHYPFSKWELAAEIDALVDGARRANSRARVVASVRDIPAQTRHEPVPAADWARRVIGSLHERFDAVMVHGEVELTPLNACLPLARELRLPVVYTGLVAEPATPVPALPGPYVISSIGGGRDAAGLEATCLAAWRLLRERGRAGDHVLVACGGLRDAADRHAAPGVACRGFDRRFPAWLAAARLSVSYAGYNTCAALLQAGVRAVLVPNPRMSDQAARAAVMATVAGAAVLPAERLDAASLAEAMAAMLAAPRPAHAVRCDGAARAATFIEGFAS